ncbi:MAG: response regulator [Eubacteriales bacterium]|nr:response regulator [Eubacteriales bacterium]
MNDHMMSQIVDTLIKNYKLIYLIDLQKDIYYIYRHSAVKDEQIPETGCYSEFSDNYNRAFVHPSHQELRGRFGNIDYLKAALKEEEAVSCDYLMANGEARRSVFRRFEMECGEPVSVIMYSHRLDRERTHRLAERQRRSDEYQIIKGLCSQYSYISILDLKTKRFRSYLSQLPEDTNLVLESRLYDDARDWFASNYVFEEDREKYLKETALETICSKVKEQGYVNVVFRLIPQFRGTKSEQWCKYVFVPANKDASQLLFATGNITQNMISEIERRKSLEKALDDAGRRLSIVGVLTTDFSDAFFSDMQENTAIMFKSGGVFLDEKDYFHTSYDESLELLLERVPKDEVSMVRQALDRKTVLEKTELESNYHVVHHLETDGELHTMQMQASRIPGTNKVIAAERNIDDIVAAAEENERKIREALEQAKRASQAKSDFLFQASHEFHTPLNAVLGFTQMMEKHLDDPVKLKEYLENVKTAGTELLGLVDRLLNVAAMQEAEEEAEPESGPKPKAQEPFSLEGKHILLAEDNELNAEITMAVLEEFGAETSHAEDGAVCLKLIEQDPAGTYDLVFMDIQMPNMNGYEATRAIRELPDEKKAGIPIIALSANYLPEDIENSLASGMNGHLSKPIDIEKMTAMAASVLNA